MIQEYTRRAEDNLLWPHVKKTFAANFAWMMFIGITGMIGSNFWVLLELRSTTQTLTANYQDLQKQITQVKSDLAETRGQMVGWDVLSRMQSTFSTMAAQGKGNQAMAVFGQVIHNEVTARDVKK
jgi:hypothetical protein